MAIVKVSWSGGKDSTASALLHLEQGDQVIMVNYIPRFTEDIPLVSKEHYDFIMRAKEYFETRGASVHIIKGETYVEHCIYLAKKGINKGNPRGFPFPIAGKCDFQNVKKDSIAAFNCGKYDYDDIGIACDEINRFHNIDGKTKRSILIEQSYTGEMAYNLCKEFNLLSPQYSSGNRDGCTLCPNTSKRERERWLSQYPKALPILEGLQKFLMAFSYETKNGEVIQRFPLREHKVFIEHQNTLFGDEIVIN